MVGYIMLWRVMRCELSQDARLGMVWKAWRATRDYDEAVPTLKDSRPYAKKR